jgi:hypothetical protein
MLAYGATEFEQFLTAVCTRAANKASARPHRGRALQVDDKQTRTPMNGAGHDNVRHAWSYSMTQSTPQGTHVSIESLPKTPPCGGDYVRRKLMSLLFPLNRSQTCAIPPSTNSSTPVTKLDRSLQRKTAAVPISRGPAKRPRGLPCPIDLTAASTCSGPDAAANALRRDGVSTAPGLRTLIRIPDSRMSWIQALTKFRMAAFTPP